MHRQDVPRRLGIGLELLAQLQHVGVDRARGRILVRAPDLVEQPPAVERLAVVLEQIYVRYVRGQTKDERFGALGMLVPRLAEAAQARSARI